MIYLGKHTSSGCSFLKVPAREVAVTPSGPCRFILTVFWIHNKDIIAISCQVRVIYLRERDSAVH